MYRGTTPTHTFATDIDLTLAEVIYITYEQQGKELIEKEKEDITVESDSLTIKLTQEETLAFDTIADVKIQIRVRFPDGTALASNIMSVPAREILKDGVI